MPTFVKHFSYCVSFCFSNLTCHYKSNNLSKFQKSTSYSFSVHSLLWCITEDDVTSSSPWHFELSSGSNFMGIFTAWCSSATSRLRQSVAGFLPRAPELSSRPGHARFLWITRHRNRFLLGVPFPSRQCHSTIASRSPVHPSPTLHNPSSAASRSLPNKTCGRHSLPRDVRGVLRCTHTHTHTHFCQEMCHTCTYALHQYGPLLYFYNIKDHKPISSDKVVCFQNTGVFVLQYLMV